MRVLVTDGDARAALAVTRSLGRLGHDVLVGETHLGALAHGSRYCARRLVYPDPAREPDTFADVVAGLVQTHAIDVLLPVADISTFIVAAQRHRIECRVPLAETTVIERAANKVDVTETAARIGVPVPRGQVLASRELPAALPFDFPLVVKPWRSRVRTPHGWVSLSVSHVRTQEELTRDLNARPDCAFPVLLQERIVGPGLGVFACFDEGRPVALFSHRRLRERPPWGGVSVLSESVPLDPLTVDYATRLLAEIGWQGPAMVEFKLDARDGTPRLMEINGRFWGSLQLAIDAGVDFPSITLQTLRHGPFPPQTPYAIGVKSRWFWGDFDSLVLRWRQKDPEPAGDPVGGRLRSLAAFLKFRGRNLYYDNPKWDDPWPWLVETRSRLRVAWSVAAAGATRVSRSATRTQ